MPPKKTVPGQQSFADVLKKTIEEKEKEKKEENEEEEEEEEEEVITLGDSTTSDGPSSESYVPSDSVSNPLGDSELVRDKGTSFNVYEQKDRNVEKTRKELDRLVENPSADAGGSDSEDKSFDDWVDERAIELWQHWAFGGDEKNENLAAFFEHYVKMRERNPPSSDEE